METTITVIFFAGGYRFRSRFHLVGEDFRTRGTPLKQADLAELEASWQAAKAKLGDTN